MFQVGTARSSNRSLLSKFGDLQRSTRLHSGKVRIDKSYVVRPWLLLGSVWASTLERQRGCGSTDSVSETQGAVGSTWAGLK